MTTPGSAKRAAKIDDIKQRKGLGRRPSADEMDKQFPLRSAMLRRIALPTSKTWPLTTGVLDQGSTSQCVAYSWTQWLMAAPVTHRVGSLGVLSEFADTLYTRAKQLDEWPGENYDGTSVRAGAKALVGYGHIATVEIAGDKAGYRWAANAAEARDYVLGIGPVVFGTDWYNEMFAPDAHGFIKPIGGVAGGHAYLIIGFSKPRNAFRIVNSWGPGWGQNGRAWLAFKDADKLVQEQGEACSAIEVRPVV